MTPLKIAVAQINCVVGDLAGNARRILAAANDARAAGADLLLTPELALCGCPPEDLLLRPDFYRACARELRQLAAALPIPAVVGYPEAEGGHRYNAAALIGAGKIGPAYRKQRLLNAEVFDEQRYFDPGAMPVIIEIKGVRIGLSICEDIRQRGAAEAARAAGVELLLTLNASPFHARKLAGRHAALATVGIPLIYANLVGGQDELVFDGSSFALDAAGRVTHQLPAFEESLAIIEYAQGRLLAGEIAPALTAEAEIYAALKLGVRDYLGKNGFSSAILGFSGGMDSALTLAIAVDALGPERVRAVMMPSPYTAEMSLADAREMARRLGVRYDEIPIEPAMATYAAMLEPLFAGLPPTAWADTTPENIQARIRGMILMALSNRTGAMVLTTGNKSEMAVGYATLYGDMAGGFAVIKDVFKTTVYKLAHYRNSIAEVIPANIITRAPSAELKPNQTDQDTLPPYEVLDAIIEACMERDESPREIIARGYAEADVRRVIGMLRKNEYKRRQAPVGIRVSRRAFGKDWRYPLTSRYSSE
ncbi:MAG: NAD+ synthase [Zoogloeaceae bacterium]|jgi:NAD+ synthetase|nr:NAD+ synthase [Zoogloeaceae bacterium]